MAVPIALLEVTRETVDSCMPISSATVFRLRDADARSLGGKSRPVGARFRRRLSEDGLGALVEGVRASSRYAGTRSERPSRRRRAPSSRRARNRFDSRAPGAGCRELSSTIRFRPERPARPRRARHFQGAAPKARPGFGSSARTSASISATSSSSTPQAAQGRQIAPCDEVETGEQRLHGGVEPVAVAELDRETLRETPRPDPGGSKVWIIASTPSTRSGAAPGARDLFDRCAAMAHSSMASMRWRPISRSPGSRVASSSCCSRCSTRLISLARVASAGLAIRARRPDDQAEGISAPGRHPARATGTGFSSGKLSREVPSRARGRRDCGRGRSGAMDQTAG